MPEYALLLALVGVAAMVAMTFMGGSINYCCRGLATHSDPTFPVTASVSRSDLLRIRGRSFCLRS
jgi:hypothetical protein